MLVNDLYVLSSLLASLKNQLGAYMFFLELGKVINEITPIFCNFINSKFACTIDPRILCAVVGFAGCKF